VAMPADTARRLGAAETGALARLKLHRGLCRRLVVCDQPQGLIASINDLNGAHDYALEWVPANRSKPSLAGERLHMAGQKVEVQCIARERSDVISAAPFHHRMERGRMRDLALLEFGLVIGDGYIDTAAGNETPLVEGVFARMPQRHEFVILLELGEWQPRRPADKVYGYVPGAFQRLGHRCELGARGDAVEAASLDANGMDFASAQDAHEAVAGLFQRETVAHDVTVFARHLDRVGKAEEIRRVQHRHMKGMARDPLAAIDQPPEHANFSAGAGAEGALDRVNRAHLVGDGTNAANPRDDVGHLGVAPTTQKGLEEARRLENFELRRGHPAAGDFEVQRA